MITYPSTHGVFEETIREICEIIHANGGQVYMDGANMNAQVGLCRPGDIGADVCHLNLHKTFCIPHGGGGPGVGPIGVAEHLVEFLPGHPSSSISAANQPSTRIGPVAAAPWGSASILTISWMYIAMMGADGLTEGDRSSPSSTRITSPSGSSNIFPTLYRQQRPRRARMHPRPAPVQERGIAVEDVAKRLMDYGFHAPTLSWPVAGTLMVEPTESESKYELDRFCDAMISIHAEMTAIETGAGRPEKQSAQERAAHRRPGPGDNWNHPYSREQAAFPANGLHDYKFWPAVARIDNVFGDRNLFCTCPPMEEFAE